ncbi:MAG TPA: hypothetical protein VN739_09215 [Nitrososphaerales archaeon]|nr:hypothetical protein [Nitrososphaerales archaeon]
MTSKLTVYVDDSVRKSLRESARGKKISQIVNDALESYLSSTLVRDLSFPDKGDNEFPSLSEVVKKRPRVRGSSAGIIASQRRGRSARLSR